MRVIYAAAVLAAAMLATTGQGFAETAAEFIKRDNPRTVKDVGRNGQMMLVGVLDDGTSRDGLAQALCYSVADKPDMPGTIRIMDVAASVRGEWKELGKAFCERLEQGEAETLDLTGGAE